jgi:hypothetical protein
MPSLNEPVPDLRGTIPDKAFCDELLDTYLATYELIYRTVYIPTFLQEYERFWTKGSSSHQLIMKLVLMLATATSLLPHNDDKHHLQRLSRTWIYACQWWLMGPTEKLSFNIESVQIAVLLQIARQMTGMGRSWSTSGFLLQMAFATGLQRDPDNFPNLSRARAELRRRLWSSILELTLLAANDTSVPATLELSEFDTRPPRNIDDSDLCHANDSVSELGPADSSPRFTTLQHLLRESFELRLKANKLIQHTGKEQIYEETIDVAEKLKDACRHLAKHFSEANGRIERGKFRLSNLHHHFLDVQLRRYILALHQPFAICKCPDPAYYLSRKLCRESALIIASHGKPTDGAEIDTIRLNKFFERTTGTLRGPLSLDVITMLALELLSQLEDAGVANDPAAQFEKASKDQILDALTRICNRLRERITAGAPNLKAYGLTRAIVSQTMAIQNGESPKAAIENVMLIELSELRGSLHATVDILSHSMLPGAELQPDMPLYQDLQLESDWDCGMLGTFQFSLWDDFTL